MKRYQKLKRNKPLKRTPIKRTYKKKTNKSGESQWDIFMQIWDESNKRCSITGRSLKRFENTSMFPNCFMHILPKGKYKRFKFLKENILLVHPEVHRLYDAGTEEQRAKSGINFDVIYTLRDNLKKQYYASNQ